MKLNFQVSLLLLFFIMECNGIAFRILDFYLFLITLSDTLNCIYD